MPIAVVVEDGSPQARSVLQWLTWLNPLRFGVEIVRRIYLEGAPLCDLMSSFAPLFIMAVVSLPLAAWLFRNRLA